MPTSPRLGRACRRRALRSSHAPTCHGRRGLLRRTQRWMPRQRSWPSCERSASASLSWRGCLSWQVCGGATRVVHIPSYHLAQAACAPEVAGDAHMPCADPPTHAFHTPAPQRPWCLSLSSSRARATPSLPSRMCGTRPSCASASLTRGAPRCGRRSAQKRWRRAPRASSRRSRA